MYAVHGEAEIEHDSPPSRMTQDWLVSPIWQSEGSIRSRTSPLTTLWPTTRNAELTARTASSATTVDRGAWRVMVCVALGASLRTSSWDTMVVTVTGVVVAVVARTETKSGLPA